MAAGRGAAPAADARRASVSASVTGSPLRLARRTLGGLLLRRSGGLGRLGGSGGRFGGGPLDGRGGLDALGALGPDIGDDGVQRPVGGQAVLGVGRRGQRLRGGGGERVGALGFRAEAPGLLLQVPEARAHGAHGREAAGGIGLGFGARELGGERRAPGDQARGLGGFGLRLGFLFGGLAAAGARIGVERGEGLGPTAEGALEVARLALGARVRGGAQEPVLVGGALLDRRAQGMELGQGRVAAGRQLARELERLVDARGLVAAQLGRGVGAGGGERLLELQRGVSVGLGGLRGGARARPEVLVLRLDLGGLGDERLERGVGGLGVLEAAGGAQAGGLGFLEEGELEVAGDRGLDALGERVGAGARDEGAQRERARLRDPHGAGVGVGPAVAARVGLGLDGGEAAVGLDDRRLLDVGGGAFLEPVDPIGAGGGRVVAELVLGQTRRLLEMEAGREQLRPARGGDARRGGLEGGRQAGSGCQGLGGAAKVLELFSHGCLAEQIRGGGAGLGGGPAAALVDERAAQLRAQLLGEDSLLGVGRDEAFHGGGAARGRLRRERGGGVLVGARSGEQLVEQRFDQRGRVLERVGVAASGEVLAPRRVEDVGLAGRARQRGARGLERPGFLVRGLKGGGEPGERGRQQAVGGQRPAGLEARLGALGRSFLAEGVGRGREREAGGRRAVERVERLPVHGRQAPRAGLALQDDDAALGQGLDAGRAEGLEQQGERGARGRGGGSGGSGVGGGSEESREERGLHQRWYFAHAWRR
ncbi:MAG: hypothetical protein M0D55_13865 [Elusimicrobiota bacterium]|nr:MAG: hypothetical protein M0D55_13865 [Elusimicrobiota bacterium]